MRVLHINTFDNGGAATACTRIHLELLKRGIDSKILFLRKTRATPETYSFPGVRPTFHSRIVARLSGNKKKKKKDLLMRYSSRIEIFSMPESPYDITEHELYKQADIIQLNWVGGFLDEPSFFKKNKKPVIWRMADLYACGAGYHYETDFPFQELKPLLEENFALRSRSLGHADITFVPISQWVKEKADASQLIGRFNKVVINNGLDLDVFKPADKAFSRKLFNLPLDSKIVLFGAESIANKRKGFGLLLQAMEQFKDSPIYICVFGKANGISHPNVIHVGEIKDDRLLSLLYSSADIFVMPSIEEAFGQVTIEALACGTPVVSFPTGGSFDIIIENQNGILASNFTHEALGKAIRKALDTEFDRDLIREDTVKRFNIENKVSEYIALYKKLLHTS